MIRRCCARGDYPEQLKARIASRLGHLDNASAAALLAALDFNRLQHVIAAHLSQSNNRPELARAALAERSAARCTGLRSPIRTRASAGGNWRDVAPTTERWRLRSERPGPSGAKKPARAGRSLVLRSAACEERITSSLPASARQAREWRLSRKWPPGRGGSRRWRGSRREAAGSSFLLQAVRAECQDGGNDEGVSHLVSLAVFRLLGNDRIL